MTSHSFWLFLTPRPPSSHKILDPKTVTSFMDDPLLNMIIETFLSAHLYYTTLLNFP